MLELSISCKYNLIKWKLYWCFYLNQPIFLPSIYIFALQKLEYLIGSFGFFPCTMYIVGRWDQIRSRGRNTISQSIGFQSYGQLVTTWHASVHKGGAVRMTRFQQNHCAGRTMQVAKIQIQTKIQIGCQDD